MQKAVSVYVSCAQLAQTGIQPTLTYDLLHKMYTRYANLKTKTNHSLCKLYASYRNAFHASCVQDVYKMRKPENERTDTRGTDDGPATYINRKFGLCKLCKPATYSYVSCMTLQDTCK